MVNLVVLRLAFVFAQVAYGESARSGVQGMPDIALSGYTRR